MGYWYPGYEEKFVRFLDNRITIALAIEMRNARADSFRHPGLYIQASGPQPSPLGRKRAPVARRASGVSSRT